MQAIRHLKGEFVMEPPEYNYKSEQRISKILSCTLEIGDLKKLFKLLKRLMMRPVKMSLIL